MGFLNTSFLRHQNQENSCFMIPLRLIGFQLTMCDIKYIVILKSIIFNIHVSASPYFPLFLRFGLEY